MPSVKRPRQGIVIAQRLNRFFQQFRLLIGYGPFPGSQDIGEFLVDLRQNFGLLGALQARLPGSQRLQVDLAVAQVNLPILSRQRRLTFPGRTGAADRGCESAQPNPL